MPAKVKAIVFRTSRFKETRYFFEKVLQLSIHEASARHFVVCSKGIRLVFMESKKGFKAEIYIVQEKEQCQLNNKVCVQVNDIQEIKDPNGIQIIITNQPLQKRQS